MNTHQPAHHYQWVTSNDAHTSFLTFLEIVTSTRLRSTNLINTLDRQPLCPFTRNHHSLLVGDTDAFSPPRMALQPQRLLVIITPRHMTSHTLKGWQG